jgi:hypothetical protein
MISLLAFRPYPPIDLIFDAIGTIFRMYQWPNEQPYAPNIYFSL